MIKLSVNVNKLATIRNSRGKNNPDLLKSTQKIIEYGAEGITVHPRPDERHIRRTDVVALANAIDVELNIEGYPSEDYLKLIEEVQPAQVTLVPDPPHVLTSDAGWKLKENLNFLTNVTSRIHQTGARVSLFMDPRDDDHDTSSLLKSIGADRIELYTEEFAIAFGTEKESQVLKSYLILAEKAHEAGLGVNAGHDLNLENLPLLARKIPFLSEVSIGHALICDALEFGMKSTIEKYLNALR